MTATGLAWNDPIYARVKASNSLGASSDEGLVNAQDATLLTVPQAIDSGSFASSSVTESSITVSWTALTPGEPTGGSDITEYALFWDDGDDTAADIDI